MDIQLRDPSLQALLTRPKTQALPAGPAARAGKTSQSAYVSEKLPAVILDEDNKPQTRLVREENEKTENGFRRTQDFETADGREFKRTEDFSYSPHGSRRFVAQQNASGSTTTLEVITDKRDDGTFRRTSRFTDESGKTETKIEVDLNAAEVSSGYSSAGPLSNYSAIQHYAQTRGGHIDLRA